MNAARITAARTLVLVDGRCGSNDAILSEDNLVVLWQHAPASAPILSLPALVDASSEALRSEYMEWCGALADVRVGEKTLAGVLTSQLLGGGSFWWTSLIAAHSPIASPAIFDVLKLRALEHVYVSRGCRSLEYLGADTRLAGLLRSWCESLGHDFQWRKTEDSGPDQPARTHSWIKRLPHPLQALVQLVYFLRKRYLPTLLNRQERPKPLPDASLGIVTYFPNINMAEARNGRFHSQYWGPLPALVRDLGLRVNWIWFYHDSRQMDYRESAAFRQVLNRQEAVTGDRYLLLEDYLTPSRVCAAVWSYVRLAMASSHLTGIPARFILPGGTLNFFAMLKEEWYSSVRGAEAMSACLYAAAFRGLAETMPAATTRVMYVWENQSWEQSFLRIWKGLRKAPVWAVVHSPSCTSPEDLRTRLGKDPVGRLQDREVPDKLIAFGRPAADTLRAWGWPASSIVKAEALRYMQLGGKYGVERNDLPDRERRLLVVCGIMRSETAFQLALLSSASQLGGLSTYASVTIKPHPFCPVDDLVATLPFSHPVTVDQRPLEELFAEADVVFAGNSTSAAIEAAWVGLPLILTAAIDGLNMNPLTGIKGTSFVDTSEALRDQLADPARVEIEPDAFLLDPDLPCWRTLLTEPLANV